MEVCFHHWKKKTLNKFKTKQNKEISQNFKNSSMKKNK